MMMSLSLSLELLGGLGQQAHSYTCPAHAVAFSHLFSHGGLSEVAFAFRLDSHGGNYPEHFLHDKGKAI